MKRKRKLADAPSRPAKKRRSKRTANSGCKSPAPACPDDHDVDVVTAPESSPPRKRKSSRRDSRKKKKSETRSERSTKASKAATRRRKPKERDKTHGGSSSSKRKSSSRGKRPKDPPSSHASEEKSEVSSRTRKGKQARRKTEAATLPPPHAKKKRKMSLMSRRMQGGSAISSSSRAKGDESERSSSSLPESPVAAPTTAEGSRKRRQGRKGTNERSRRKGCKGQMSEMNANFMSQLTASLSKFQKSYSKKHISDSTLRERIGKVCLQESKKGRQKRAGAGGEEASVLRERIQVLERQRAVTEKKLKKLEEVAKREKKLQQLHKDFERRAENLEKDNDAMRLELAEVKQSWFENGKNQDASSKRLELAGRERKALRNTNNQLLGRARELAAETEARRQQDQRDFERKLEKMREDHAEIVGNLQVELKAAREERDRALSLVSQGRDPVAEGVSPSTPTHAPTAHPGGCGGSMSPNSAMRSDLAEKLRKAQAAHHSGQHKLTLQRQDIESLRAALEEKRRECSQSLRTVKLYKILSGIMIKTNDLYFDCRAEKPENPGDFFEFRLHMKSDSPSLFYEKHQWKSAKPCPQFLKQSGNYFLHENAPLFLKCLLQEFFGT